MKKTKKGKDKGGREREGKLGEIRWMERERKKTNVKRKIKGKNECVCVCVCACVRVCV